MVSIANAYQDLLETRSYFVRKVNSLGLLKIKKITTGFFTQFGVAALTRNVPQMKHA